MSSPPLVIFHKQLGDVLLLEPALLKIATAVDSDVILATRPAFSPMISLMDRVRPLPSGLFRKASSVLSFDPRSRACFQSLVTRAPEKRLVVTNQKYLRRWHGVFFPTERRVVDESALYRAEYYFNQVPGKTDAVFTVPRLNQPSPSWLPKELPAQYVLIHPTSAWKSKSWSVENWAAAIDALDAQGLGPFVMTGGSQSWEFEYAEAIGRITRASVLNFCGRTDMKGYLATIANARMVLCIDGSAAHLAAAFRRSSVVLFGPTHPLHWHYPTDYSTMIDARLFSNEQRPSVTRIPVASVVEAALKQWVSLS